MDNNTGDVTATGNVKLIDGDNTMSSQNIMVNFRTNYVRIDQGSIFIKSDNYHINGDTIERVSEDTFKIKSANFTTCDGELPCWRFKGENINLYMSHILTARNVSLAVMDIPVFYLPYIALPILNKRQTGFLIPRVGYNSSKGLKVNNAFFWAISDTQDATVYADYYGKKGWGAGLEYRYIFSSDTSGQFNGYYIKDIQVDRTRWDIKYNHRQEFSEGLSAKLRINYLNDKTLFKDLSENIGERVQRAQDSDLYINRKWDTLSMHLWGEYTQNLAGPGKGIFNRLPEAELRVMDTKISDLPLYWNLASSAARWEEINTGLTQLHFAPGISARLFETTGFVFVPEIGTDQTFYYIDGDKGSVRSGLYSIGASLSTKFYRAFDAGSGHLEHFVEPVLRYEYAEVSSAGTPPFPDPNPPFPPFVKEGIKETSVTGKNLITFSIINRIVSMDRDKSYEPLYLRLTQMYRMKSSSILSPPPSGFSDLRAETIIRLHEAFSMDIDATYSHKDSTFQSAGADLEFKGNNTHLTIGDRYDKSSSIKFLTASAGLKLDKVDNSVTLWYDDRSHVMQEADYSVKYSSQCWGVTFFYRYKPGEEQYYILLTLTGLGSV